MLYTVRTLCILRLKTTAVERSTLDFVFELLGRPFCLAATAHGAFGPGAHFTVPCYDELAFIWAGTFERAGLTFPAWAFYEIRRPIVPSYAFSSQSGTIESEALPTTANMKSIGKDKTTHKA